MKTLTIKSFNELDNIQQDQALTIWNNKGNIEEIAGDNTSIVLQDMINILDYENLLDLLSFDSDFKKNILKTICSDVGEDLTVTTDRYGDYCAMWESSGDTQYTHINYNLGVYFHQYKELFKLISMFDLDIQIRIDLWDHYARSNYLTCSIDVDSPNDLINYILEEVKDRELVKQKFKKSNFTRKDLKEAYKQLDLLCEDLKDCFIELNEKIRNYFNWDYIFENEIEFVNSRDYCSDLNIEFILNGDQIVDVNRY
ncbi:MAG: hypothetical protein VZQ49_00305 [Methanobrevibacter sp.]|nr:hypothetical protein [Methanobrevibacter sp.]